MTRYLAPVLAGALSLTGCRQAVDPTLVRLNGRIEAAMVDLSPKVTGRVREVLVKEGDRVKAGDVLVRLDLGETGLTVARDKSAVAAAQARVRDLEAGTRGSDLAAAEAEVNDRKAALELARKELQRQQFMLDKKVGTQRDVDRATTDVERLTAAVSATANRLTALREGARRNQVQQARDEVARAETVLEQSQTVVNEGELRAPADTIVVHRFVEPGQLVTPGQPVLTLAFLDRLYVRTFVPETVRGRVRPGIEADVVVDAYKDKVFKGKVAEIARDAEFTPKQVETRTERVNLVYAAKIDLVGGWNEPLDLGQPAEVLIKGAVITTSDLTRRFGAVTALAGITIEVPRGEMFALIGPDGAGKTTFFRLVAGVLAPTSGTVTRATGTFGLVPQRFGLYQDLSIDENMRLRSDLYSVPRAEAERRATRLLDMVGLAPFRARLAGALSGGMKQKLALAAALVTEPDLLLLDEPTTGVDPLSRREFWKMLHELNHRGLTIVVSTPYMDEAEYASRIAFLDGGRLVDVGTRAELLGRFDRPLVSVATPDRVGAKQILRAIPGVDDVSLFGTALHVRGTSGDSAALAEEIRRAFAGAGRAADADSIAPIAPSLEDVFVLRSEAVGRAA